MASRQELSLRDKAAAIRAERDRQTDSAEWTRLDRMYAETITAARHLRIADRRDATAVGETAVAEALRRRGLRDQSTHRLAIAARNRALAPVHRERAAHHVARAERHLPPPPVPEPETRTAPKGKNQQTEA